MLAIVIGSLSLLVGFGMLSLPLIATELSRPRDSFWGAVLLFLGLVLITNNERFLGSPMLAVLCSAMLIGRLGYEVGLSRWMQLDESEKTRLTSFRGWLNSLRELVIVASKTGDFFGESIRILSFTPNQPKTTKQWVHPEDRLENSTLQNVQQRDVSPLESSSDLIKEKLESDKSIDLPHQDS